MEPLAEPRVGGDGRTGDGEARRGDPRCATAPGAGISLVPRALAALEGLWRRAGGGRVRAGDGRGGALLSPYRIDVEARPRPARAERRRKRESSRPREHPRAWLLPLKEEGYRSAQRTDDRETKSAPLGGPPGRVGAAAEGR